MFRKLMLAIVAGAAFLSIAPAGAQDASSGPPGYYGRPMPPPGYQPPPPPRQRYQPPEERYERGYERRRGWEYEERPRYRRARGICATSRGACPAPPLPVGSSCRCDIDGLTKRGIVQ